MLRVISALVLVLGSASPASQRGAEAASNGVAVSTADGGVFLSPMIDIKSSQVVGFVRVVRAKPFGKKFAVMGYLRWKGWILTAFGSATAGENNVVNFEPGKVERTNCVGKSARFADCDYRQQFTVWLTPDEVNKYAYNDILIVRVHGKDYAARADAIIPLSYINAVYQVERKHE